MIWPVPGSKTRELPKECEAGSFWEDRGDRHHCGVDIYADVGAEVVSVTPGKVLDSGIFTSPAKVKYWNVTYFIVIKGQDGLFYRYAEMKDVNVNIGDEVEEGQVIGHVGSVLNILKIDSTSPGYIQKLKDKKNPSMLHFEIFKKEPVRSKDYLGGNWFKDEKPEGILDPKEVLKGCS